MTKRVEYLIEQLGRLASTWATESDDRKESCFIHWKWSRHRSSCFYLVDRQTISAVFSLSHTKSNLILLRSNEFQYGKFHEIQWIAIFKYFISFLLFHRLLTFALSLTLFRARAQLFQLEMSVNRSGSEKNSSFKLKVWNEDESKWKINKGNAFAVVRNIRNAQFSIEFEQKMNSVFDFFSRLRVISRLSVSPKLKREKRKGNSSKGNEVHVVKISLEFVAKFFVLFLFISRMSETIVSSDAINSNSFRMRITRQQNREKSNSHFGLVFESNSKWKRGQRKKNGFKEDEVAQIHFIYSSAFRWSSISFLRFRVISNWKFKLKFLLCLDYSASLPLCEKKRNVCSRVQIHMKSQNRKMHMWKMCHIVLSLLWTFRTTRTML